MAVPRFPAWSRLGVSGDFTVFKTERGTNADLGQTEQFCLLLRHPSIPKPEEIFF